MCVLIGKFYVEGAATGSYVAAQRNGATVVQDFEIRNVTLMWKLKYAREEYSLATVFSEH